MYVECTGARRKREKFVGANLTGRGVGQGHELVAARLHGREVVLVDGGEAGGVCAGHEDVGHGAKVSVADA